MFVYKLIEDQIGSKSVLSTLRTATSYYNNAKKNILPSLDFSGQQIETGDNFVSSSSTTDIASEENESTQASAKTVKTKNAVLNLKSAFSNIFAKWKANLKGLRNQKIEYSYQGNQGINIGLSVLFNGLNNTLTTNSSSLATTPASAPIAPSTNTQTTTNSSTTTNTSTSTPTTTNPTTTTTNSSTSTASTSTLTTAATTYTNTQTVQSTSTTTFSTVQNESLYSSTQDGKIDSTIQGKIADCWILSGINALSYTTEGKRIIEEALDYQKNGDTIVHLKGIGDYTITLDELNEARSKRASYSKGDDDMLIFELALEKVMNDKADMNYKYKSNVFFESAASVKNDILEHNTSIWGGNTTELLYLLTGKSAQTYINKEAMSSALTRFNGKNIAMTATLASKSEVLDINGKTVSLPGGHSYAIKDVKNGVITLTDPWNSGKDIVIKKDTFLQTFTTLSLCDLSNKNPFVSYIKV